MELMTKYYFELIIDNNFNIEIIVKEIKISSEQIRNVLGKQYKNISNVASNILYDNYDEAKSEGDKWFKSFDYRLCLWKYKIYDAIDRKIDNIETQFWKFYPFDILNQFEYELFDKILINKENKYKFLKSFLYKTETNSQRIHEINKLLEFDYSFQPLNI